MSVRIKKEIRIYKLKFNKAWLKNIHYISFKVLLLFKSQLPSFDGTPNLFKVRQLSYVNKIYNQNWPYLSIDLYFAMGPCS